jgi:DNA primase
MFQQIKQLIAVKNAIEHYGFKINRAGFIPCPFHSEKTASLKVFSKNNKWKCFGCGQGGGVIDFVMKLHGITFQQALVRLNHDFNLNLTNEKPDLRQINRLKEEKKRKERLQRARLLVYEYNLLEFKKTYRTFHDLKPSKHGEELSDEFIETLLHLPRLEDWLTRWEVRRGN